VLRIGDCKRAFKKSIFIIEILDCTFHTVPS